MNEVKKRNKIWFIVLVTIFSILWIASLVFLGISYLSEGISESIQNWYADVFTTKTNEASLNLKTTSLISTIIFTCALLIVLLFKELKKKYSGRKKIGE